MDQSCPLGVTTVACLMELTVVYRIARNDLIDDCESVMEAL